MWCSLLHLSLLVSVIECKFDPSIITGSNSDEGRRDEGRRDEEGKKNISYYDEESSNRCYRTTRAEWEI